MSQAITPFESIRRTNPTGSEFWSSRDFAKVLGYINYRHFQAVIEKARIACSNSDQRVEIGSGAQRPLKTVMMSRYACDLVIQNAEIEEQRRLAIRSELRTHNSQLADAAKDAGVIEPRDYAIFQNHGYMRLYGGLGAQDIHRRKGLKKANRFSTTWAAPNSPPTSYALSSPRNYLLSQINFDLLTCTVPHKSPACYQWIVQLINTSLNLHTPQIITPLELIESAP